MKFTSPKQTLSGCLLYTSDMQYKSQLEQIVMRHRRTVDEVVDPACRAEVLATVNTLLDELSNIFNGVYLIKDQMCIRDRNWGWCGIPNWSNISIRR